MTPATRNDCDAAHEIETVRRIHGWTNTSLCYRLAQEVERLDRELFLAREEIEQNKAAARIGARAVRDLRLIHTIA